MTEPTVAHILERWGMVLAPSSDPEEKWFLDWVLKSPKRVSGHLTAGWHAYSSLLEVYSPEDIETAMEYFGGIGAQALMIQHLFGPEKHVVGDYAESSYDHLRTVLPAPVWAAHMDAYDFDSPVAAADLVGLDFGDLTAWRTRKGQKHRRLLDRVFSHEPKAVVITDIAGAYLHLNRNSYEPLLGSGRCETYPGYLDAFSDYLTDLYGYRLQSGYVNGKWSAVMAYVPAGVGTPTARDGRPNFHPVPATPIGLELL